jgi:hypothetical protein
LTSSQEAEQEETSVESVAEQAASVVEPAETAAEQAASVVEPAESAAEPTAASQTASVAPLKATFEIIKLLTSSQPASVVEPASAAEPVSQTV